MIDCARVLIMKLMTLELLTQLPITPKQGSANSMGHNRSESNSSLMSFSSSMKDALAMLDDDLERVAEVTTESNSAAGAKLAAGADHSGWQGA